MLPAPHPDRNNLIENVQIYINRDGLRGSTLITCRHLEMKFALLVSAIAGLAATAVQAYETGVDVSALTSTSAWSCAKKLGYDHAIVRCYIEAYGGNPASIMHQRRRLLRSSVLTNVLGW